MDIEKVNNLASDAESVISLVSDIVNARFAILSAKRSAKQSGKEIDIEEELFNAFALLADECQLYVKTYQEQIADDIAQEP
jgi:hypothetical protein